MRETSTEISSVNILLPSLGQVDLLATGAVNLEAGGAQLVGQSDGKYLLTVAKGPRTCSKDAVKVLLVNFSETSR